MTESISGRGTIFDFLRTEEVGSRLLSFSNRQTLFRPTDPANDLYLIESGEIRLFDASIAGRRRLLEILGPSELCGLSALGMLTSHGKLAESIGNSQVRAVPADRLRTALASRGELAVQFVQILALQLHNIWTEGSTFIFEDCRIRLIRKLMWFANSPAATPSAGGVELHITHAQLAQAIGAARETVSICLMNLRKENIVETRRNRVIYDPDRLSQLYPEGQNAQELAIAG